MSKKYVSLFYVYVEHHYSDKSFLGMNMRKKYFLYLFSVYGIKSPREIYKQKCYLEIFCTYSFNDSTNSQN